MVTVRVQVISDGDHEKALNDLRDFLSDKSHIDGLIDGLRRGEKYAVGLGGGSGSLHGYASLFSLDLLE